jgi:hypothetical protein
MMKRQNICRGYPFLVIAAFVCLFSFSLSIKAEVTIVSIIKKDKAVDKTGEVLYTRFGSLKPEKKVEKDMVLHTGDQLKSKSKHIILVIRCSHTPLSEFKFSGGFHVEINPPGEKDCVFDLKGGSVDVLTGRPTKVSSGGEINLSSERTQYGVRILPGGRGPLREWLVYEGKANIQSPVYRGDLSEGQKIIMAGSGSTHPVSIRIEDIVPAAKVYAMVITSEIMSPKSTRLSISFPLRSKKKNRSGHIGVTFKGKSEHKNIFSMFRRLYLNVLANPSDPEPRLKLASQLMAYGDAAETLYHVNYTKNLSTDKQQEAYAVLLKALVQHRLEKFDKRDDLFEKAKELDYLVFEKKNLKHFGLGKEFRKEIKTIEKERKKIEKCFNEKQK